MQMRSVDSLFCRHTLNPRLHLNSSISLITCMNLLDTSVSGLEGTHPIKSFQYVERRWSPTCEDLSMYSVKRSKLVQGFVMLGSRVFIPSQGRSTVLQALNEGHPNMTKMETLSRMYVFIKTERGGAMASRIAKVFMAYLKVYTARTQHYRTR